MPTRYTPRPQQEKQANYFRAAKERMLEKIRCEFGVTDIPHDAMLCSACRKVLHKSQFWSKGKDRREGVVRGVCKSCVRQRHRGGCKPKRVRRSRPKTARPETPFWWAPKEISDQTLERYGLTREALSEMISRQGFCCAICSVGGDKMRMVIDHDHKTGFVRGLLCPKCNMGIGNLRDDASVIKNAAKYIEEAVERASVTR